MGPRALVFWGLAAAVSTGAAVYLSLEATDRLVDAARLDEPVFVALRDQAESVAGITVTQGETTVSVTLEDGVWVVPDRHGYAADVEVVREVVTGLADLRFAAPRTALPERFARLEVDDPGPESAARRMTVTATDGAVLADAIIGKRSDAVTADRRGTYLRLPDGDHAWLASGTVEIATTSIDWLDTDLPGVDREAVETLVVVPAEGEGFTVGRLAAEDDLTLMEPQLDEGRTTDPAGIRRLASVFTSLRFDDLLPAGELAWPETVTTLTATTFDETTFTAEIATIDEVQWVRFGDDADWVYRLPDFQIQRLTVTLEDLLQEPEAS